MAVMILGTYTPRSPEWHDARRWRVGGSDVAVILGLAPWATSRDDLMRQKLDGTTSPETPAMRRGRWLEPAVLTAVAERDGLTYDPAASAATYIHDFHDWALYHPDAIATNSVLVEAKTTSDRTTEHGWGRAGTDAIPTAYQCQVAWGCGVTGADRWVLGVCHGATNGRPDLDVALYRGAADPALFARLLAHCGRWHTRLIDTRDRTAA